MTQEIEYKSEQVSINITVSTHETFINCVEDHPSPFKHGEVFLNPSLNINEFSEIVIKCLIQDNQRPKIELFSKSAQEICHEAVEIFVNMKWGAKRAFQKETLNCNQFEQQYKYLIPKY